MTTQEFIEKYTGKKLDWDKAYGGQCVDLFRFYIHEVMTTQQPKGVVGAADFWTGYDSDPILKDNFTKIANTPDGVPQEGDVIIWNKKAGGGFGHIAVFIKGNANTFTSFDQNWRALNVCEPTEHNYTNVYGWLRPKESSMGNELEICLKDRQKFWDERDSLLRELNAENVDGGISSIRGLRSRITDLGNQAGEAQAEVKNLTEKVGRIEKQVLDEQDRNKLLSSQLNEAEADVVKFAKDKGNLEIALTKLQTQYDSLKQAQIEGGVTLTIGEVLRLILKQKITIKK